MDSSSSRCIRMVTEQKRFRKDDSSKGKKLPSTNILDRSPPFDLASEMGVLGSMILNPDICNDLALELRADDFYDDAHRKLYAAMMNLFDSGRKMDPTLLVSDLKAAGDFDLIGGTAYLIKLSNCVPNPAHAKYYAQIVRSKATIRRLIDASTSILSDAYEESADAKELVSQAEAKIFSIQDERNANTATSVSEVLKAAMTRIDQRMQGEQLQSGVLTHFTDFDQMTGGLHNGELIILAARPSMGKTAFAMNIAEHVAMKENAPTLFVSLEMNAIELVDRMLCSIAKVDGQRLKVGTITKDDQKRLLANAAKISEAPLYIDDAPSRTVSEVAAVARRISQQEMRKPNGRKIGLIVIDYLQLLDPDNPKDPRQEQVAKMARRLKMLAREQDVPILCLSQLNRQSEEGKDHRPKLSHLRESGAIEQDADVVMFVHREGYYHRNAEDAEQYAGQAEIIIAKQRNGPVGDVELVWEASYTRFLNKIGNRHEEFNTYSDFSTPGGY